MHRAILYVVFAILFGFQNIAFAGSIPIRDRYHRDHRITPKMLFNETWRFNQKKDTPPEESAKGYLRANYNRFGIASDLGNIELDHIRKSLTGTHVHFRQNIDGIPVQGGEIVVSLRKDGNGILKVFNNIYPKTKPIPSQKNQIDKEAALDEAWNNLSSHGELQDLPVGELVYLPQGDSFRLIYQTQINMQPPHGHWRHRIDAATGDIVEVKNTLIKRIKQAAKKSPEKAEKAKNAIDTPALSRQQATERFLESQEQKKSKQSSVTTDTADGTALVFDPDPRTTLMDAFLEDESDDSDFDGAYYTRTLKDLTVVDGVYTLTGPWVEITHFSTPSFQPSTTTDGNWTATRGDNAFNDAMTYFHLDQNQRYIQSLGFTGDTGIIERAIEVDANGAGGQDNSWYDEGRLVFGHGCVDDNEDADVILHEYGHAIQDDINPNWDDGVDTGAMGEGFGDYWAGSYSLSTVNGDAFYPEWIFSWDGHNDCWSGRYMNRLAFQYDASLTYTAHDNIDGYKSDELWGTPLFQALLDLLDQGETREEVDQIVLESHFGLGSGLTMPDMAEATVAAAQNLYPDGPHAQVFLDSFSRHNIYGEATAEPEDTYESNNSSSEANEITSGETQIHSIDPSDDVDWSTFTLTEASAIALSTSGASGDSRLWLYDSDLNEVGYNDDIDGGNTDFSYLTYSCTEALAAGTYYVKVDEYENNNTIDLYYLSLSTASCDSDGDGVLNTEDAFPDDPDETVDSDSDGVGNNADTDDDNDGMSDSWEETYGLDTLDASDASSDLDGDGITNLTEYTNGTSADGSTFLDVPITRWGYSFIETLVENGITSGCDSSNYCPDNTLQRSEMAIFLLRSQYGSDYSPAAGTGTVFDDVSSSYWAGSYVERLAELGITSGCDDDNFCPSREITRSEMAIFLLRTKYGSSYQPPAATGTVFGDISADYWAAGFIEQLDAEGFSDNTVESSADCEAGDFCPSLTINRAEMAVFLVQTFGLE
ncbi:MAG: S-layer homology domain-containing protein [Magnetococcales bacterium]|nr:S-layer homology domain-containing protein [Magnetococcales bacterium]